MRGMKAARGGHWSSGEADAPVRRAFRVESRPLISQQLHINPTLHTTGLQVVVVMAIERHETMQPQPSFFSEGWTTASFGLETSFAFVHPSAKRSWKAGWGTIGGGCTCRASASNLAKFTSVSFRHAANSRRTQPFQRSWENVCASCMSR